MARRERLKSWKEIAAFFGTDERTVRRWEERGLPVRRVPGGARPTVYAEVPELEAWLKGTGGVTPIPNGAAPPAIASRRPVALNRRTAIVGGIAAAVGGAAVSLDYLLPRRREEEPPSVRAFLDRGIEASRLGTAESTAEAVGLLQEAVRQAPQSAPAWGALAIAYFESQHFLDDDQSRIAIGKSRDAAQRAIDLDPRSPAGHAALALMEPTYRNWLRAERSMRAVLALDAAQFEVRLALSRLLSNVGRIRAAIALAEPLAREQPLNPVLQYWLAFLLWQGERIEESDLLLDQALRRWPRNYAIWFTRFWQRVYTARPREALDMAAATSLRPIGIPDWNFNLIEASARAVMTRSPEDVARALVANREAALRGAGFAENAIELAAHLGALDDAFRVADAYYFNRGFVVGSGRYTAQQGSYTRPALRETKLLFNPSTRGMRSDPRFSALVREIRLADYWRESRTSPSVPFIRDPRLP